MDDGADLVDKLEAVHDRASFLEFVRELANDRRHDVGGESESRWENTSIETFLEAAESWATDIQDLKDERAEWFPEAPSWAAFARFLYVGKIYE